MRYGDSRWLRKVRSAGSKQQLPNVNNEGDQMKKSRALVAIAAVGALSLTAAACGDDDDDDGGDTPTETVADAGAGTVAGAADAVTVPEGTG